MCLGLTLKMSHLCAAPELASRKIWEDPGKPPHGPQSKHALLLSFRRGCLCRDEEGCRGEGSQSAKGRPEEAGPCSVGGSGSQAHLVCVRFIRLIANKGIRANLLI